MVSTFVLNFLLEIAVLSFIFPVVVLLTWRMRTHKSLLPAFAGVLVFLVFAKVLETVPHSFFLSMANPAAKAIRSNSILTAAYLGIVTAVFEEIGRYIAFRFFLTKYDERQTAITYGIGHGGIECMIALGITNLEYYITATVLNEGREFAFIPEDTQDALTSLTAFDCVLDGISEIFLFALQIGLSILIYQAFRNEKLRGRLFGIAILLHTAMYLPNGFYKANQMPHLVSLMLELLILGITLALAGEIYKKMGDNEKRQKEAQKQKKAASEEDIWNVAKKKLSNLDEEEKK